MLKEITKMTESRGKASYKNEIDLELFKEKINNSISWSENDIVVREAFKKTVEEFNGKKYNKKFIDALKENIGGGGFYVSPEIWGTHEWYIKISMPGAYFNHTTLKLDNEDRITTDCLNDILTYVEGYSGLRLSFFDRDSKRVENLKKQLRRVKSHANKINKIFSDIHDLNESLKNDDLNYYVTFDITSQIIK